MVSRFQFARPAVVFSFLDQIILTPPVEAERADTLPDVMVLSSSVRKVDARSCLRSLKAFFASLEAFSSFLVGLFLGEPRSIFSGDDGGFRGEYSSFHSLMTSCSQKASMLCL